MTHELDRKRNLQDGKAETPAPATIRAAESILAPIVRDEEVRRRNTQSDLYAKTFGATTSDMTNQRQDAPSAERDDLAAPEVPEHPPEPKTENIGDTRVDDMWFVMWFDSGACIDGNDAYIDGLWYDDDGGLR